MSRAPVTAVTIVLVTTPRTPVATIPALVIGPFWFGLTPRPFVALRVTFGAADRRGCRVRVGVRFVVLAMRDLPIFE